VQHHVHSHVPLRYTILTSSRLRRIFHEMTEPLGFEECRFRRKATLCSGGVCRAEPLSKADDLCVSVEVALPENKGGHEPVDHGAHE
jgi:hypothetical protein